MLEISLLALRFVIAICISKCSQNDYKQPFLMLSSDNGLSAISSALTRINGK